MATSPVTSAINHITLSRSSTQALKPPVAESPLEFSLVTATTLLVIIALATYIQTHTGFAFALIVMSLAGSFNLIALNTLAYAISFLSLVNSTTALKGALPHIDVKAVSSILLGCLPGICAGIWLLDNLSLHHQGTLKSILGAAILIYGCLLLIKPEPLPQRSAPVLFAGAGLISGVMGGLFAAFGPPLAFILYRQPFAIKTVLNTLLATFWITSVLRIGIVSVTGLIDPQVFWLIALGMPWVAACTYWSKSHRPPISDTMMKRCALILLIVSGTSLLMTGLIDN